MIENNALVSIVIPTYKRSDTLIDAINSVLSQTYSNIEVLVVDDNDPETEWRTITKNKMMAFDGNPKVKYIQHECNKNGSAARNTGIKNASGEYFCFLDDDDCYYPEKIEKQLKCLEETDADACFCDYKKNGKDVHIDEKFDFVHNIFLELPTPQTSGWLVTKRAVDLLQGFDESYYRHQDYEFLLRFFKAGLVMCKANEILYERNITTVDNNPSGKKTEMIKQKLFSDFNDLIQECEIKYPGFRKNLIISSKISAFKNYYKSRDIKNCIRLFIECCTVSISKTMFEFLGVIKSHM